MRIRASGSPNPGTGRPQYVSSRKRATFSRATFSRQATRRGQRRQATISAVSSASAAARSTPYFSRSLSSRFETTISPPIPIVPR